MVSDCIGEINSYLCLTQEDKGSRIQYFHGSDMSIWLNRGKLYWTSDKFVQQMKVAIKIAKFKYPKGEGWKHVQIFDHSSCHAAIADDSLHVSKMNQ